MDFDRITLPLRLPRGSHQPGSGKGCAMNVIADGAFKRDHSSEEIHVGDPQAGDQPRTRPTDRKTPPIAQAALSSDVRYMNYSGCQDEQRVNRGSLVIGKVLVGAAAAVISVGLAAPAGAAVPDFLAAVRAAGITGTDPAMLGDGYNVCWQLWNQPAPGTAVAAGLVRDHPQLTTDEAAHFVLAAYNDLCPVPGAYDSWAYSTS